MFKTLAAAGAAIGIMLSPLAAFAQTDTTGGAMSDKTMTDKAMAPKKMMKHHPVHKKPMMNTNMKTDTMKSGDTQQKM